MTAKVTLLTALNTLRTSVEDVVAAIHNASGTLDTLDNRATLHANDAMTAMHNALDTLTAIATAMEE